MVLPLTTVNSETMVLFYFSPLPTTLKLEWDWVRDQTIEHNSLPIKICSYSQKRRGAHIYTSLGTQSCPLIGSIEFGSMELFHLP